jgi:hypothetical protein
MSGNEIRRRGPETRPVDGDGGPRHQKVTTVQKAGISVIVVAVLGLAGPVITFVSEHMSQPAPPPSTTISPTRGSGPALTSAVIYLSKDSVPYGSTFTVSGEGFAPNQKVQLRISTFDVATPTANAQGGFANVQVSIPAFFKGFQKPMTVDVIATSSPDFSFHGTRQIVIT